MPSNLLILLPLLSGFVFIHLCYRTRYRAQTLEGYRLVFEASIWGVAFLLPAHFLAGWWSFVAAFEGWLTVDSEGSAGSLAGTLIVAPMAAWIYNSYLAVWLWREENHEPAIADLWENARRWALERALLETDDRMLLLLHRAATEEAPVCLSMKNRRAYIGLVRMTTDLRPKGTSLEILPLKSGRRDSETLQLRFDTRYPVEKYGKEIRTETFTIVLPLSEVSSVRFSYENQKDSFEIEPVNTP
ncbi:MAG TPA: hypothetical protein VGS22_16850 [Thermoanaerobaculia bacterium]|jgi:hypothetical protein|nr:hypothetical protein [Thermoanaerobaculia bacterium]